MTRITFSLKNGRIESVRKTRAAHFFLTFDRPTEGTLFLCGKTFPIAGKEVRLSPEALTPGIASPRILFPDGTFLDLEDLEILPDGLRPARLTEEELRRLRDLAEGLSASVDALKKEIDELHKTIEGNSIL